MILTMKEYKSDREVFTMLMQHKKKYIPEKYSYSSAKIWCQKSVTLSDIVLCKIGDDYFVCNLEAYSILKFSKIK